MKISVLVPSVRPDVLPFAIRSILRQTWQEWELIVIAQGTYTALEATLAEVAQGDPRVRAVRMAELGVSRARNMGLTHIDGDIVAMMDDDCEAQEDWLSVLAEIFASRPDIGMVSGALIPPKVKYGRIWFCPTVEIPEVLYDPMLPPYHPPPGWKFVTANLAVRRDIALCAGPFDPYLGAGGCFCAGEDPDWGMRLERMGVKMLTTPRSVVHHTYGVRYGLEAVMRIKRGYARGNGALAAKLTLMGSPAGRKWLAQNRRECLLEPLLNPRLVHRLYSLYFFEKAYRECLSDFYVDENCLLQPRSMKSISPQRLSSRSLVNNTVSPLIASSNEAELRGENKSDASVMPAKEGATVQEAKS